jgi:molybdopterin molybdotransferase
VIEYSEALALLDRRLSPTEQLEVLLEEALGATLAEDIHLSEDLPPFDNSAMDGYALRSDDLREASEAHPARIAFLEVIGAGQAARSRVEPGTCVQIMTGAPVPEGADCVVPVELSAREGDTVLIRKTLAPGSNIRPRGEEMRAGDLLLSAGMPIGAVEWGLLATADRPRVLVHRKPTAALLLTGNELLEPGEPAQPGAVRNSNGYTLRAAFRKLGIEPLYLGVAPDLPEAARRGVEAGLGCDVLVTVGGVSAGEFDVIRDLLADSETGFEELFYKLRIRPGKPVRCGRIGKTWVFALPGNPVSALATFHLLVKPALRKLAGWSEWWTPVLRVRLASEIVSRAPFLNFWRAGLRYDPESGVAEAVPFERASSGMLTTLLGAEGFVPVPVEAERLSAGEIVDFLPL